MKSVRLGVLRPLIFVALCVALLLVGMVPVNADTNVNWMGPGDIKRTLVSENVPYPGAAYDKQCLRIPQKENKYKYNGNKWIFDKTIPIYDGCWTKTDYGLIGNTPQGWYMRLGNEGPVARFENTSGVFVPIPNSNKLVRLYNNGTSFFRDLYIYDNVPQQYRLATPLTRGGTNEVYLNNSEPAPIRLDHLPRPNSSIAVNAVSVSNNGKWLVVEGSYMFFKLNLENMELLPFEKPIYLYGYGLNPGYTLAISNDGKYVTISTGGNNNGFFNLYDLSTCIFEPPQPYRYYEVATGCGKKSLKDVAMPNASWNAAPGNVFFSDNGENLFYNHVENGKANQYMLTVPGGDTHLLEYLALGDSFSAGEGDEDDLHYLSGTNGDGEGINNTGVVNFPYWREKCHLSDRSYPFHLGNYFGDSFRSVACAGVTVNDIIPAGGSEAYNGHFDQLKNIPVSDELRSSFSNIALDDFVPGRAAQIEFVQKYKPRVATIGVGGNDINFATKLAKCIPTTSTCEYASTHRAEIAQEISQLYGKLVEGYTQLKNASPTTRFYAVGYPQLVTLGGECQPNVLLDEYEREYAVQVASYLNKTVAAAAAKVGIQYLDIKDALAGHNLCSSADKIAVNGLVKGDDRGLDGNDTQWFAFIGNESYHPNQVGHALIAETIKSALKNEDINTFNPCAPSEALFCNTSNGDKPPVPAYFNTTGNEISVISGILNTRDAIRNLDSEIIIRGGEVILETVGDAFKALSEVEIKLFSDPVNLGKVMVDAQGKLTKTVTIPANTPPGIHTLHVVGTMPNGEKVDYYKDIFVYANETDWDGDSVINRDDKCGLVDPANEDKDEDGIDDACDGFVGDPKPRPIAVASTSRDEQGSQVGVGVALLQQADTVYNALAPSDSLTLGFVAGASTTQQVSYFDGPGRHMDGSPVQTIENALLTFGSILAVALLGVVLLFKLRHVISG